MSYTTGCMKFIAENAASERDVKRCLSEIAKKLPVEFSQIAWDDVENAMHLPSVSRLDLKSVLSGFLNIKKINLDEKCFIIQLEDAYSALFVEIQGWLNFSEELDFVDTIFCAKDCNWIVHWDFYKDLHMVKLG